MPKKASNVRQRPNGLWECRFTYVDEYGATQRKSLYGKTRKEVQEKLRSAQVSADEGTYTDNPSTKSVTVSDWLDSWIADYCIGLKPATLTAYKSQIEKQIKPYIGTVKLTALKHPQLQKYFKHLYAGDEKHKALSPKTVKNIHGIIHKALDTAVTAGLINHNPCDRIVLLEIPKPELRPLMDDDISKFLKEINGDRYELIYTVTLFSGLRQSEAIGLQWDDVDFEKGVLHISHQCQRDRLNDAGYIFLDKPKNSKPRSVTIPSSVSAMLKKEKARQSAQIISGELTNKHNLVFIDADGNNLSHKSVYDHFKVIVKRMGRPEVRFHDLRHSYAINALQNDINVKTVQEQLGHYSSSFTLDTYAAVSETMRKDCADKMEAFFKSVSNA